MRGGGLLFSRVYLLILIDFECYVSMDETPLLWFGVSFLSVIFGYFNVLNALNNYRSCSPQTICRKWMYSPVKPHRFGHSE